MSYSPDIRGPTNLLSTVADLILINQKGKKSSAQEMIRGIVSIKQDVSMTNVNAANSVKRKLDFY